MRRTTTRWVAGRFTAVLGVALVAALGGCAGGRAAEKAPEPSAPSVPYDREKSIESFEQVWKTVSDKHWDLAQAGVDWNAVHEEFRPRIEAATSMAEARDVMREMLERLGQSHFGIWPQEVYQRDEARAAAAEAPTPVSEGNDPGPSGQRATPAPQREQAQALPEPGDDGGVSGIDVRVVGDRAIVTRVEPGSPGEAAGVRPGWVLVSANGQRVDRLAERLEGNGPESISRETRLAMMVLHHLSGDIGETLTLEFLDAEDRPVTREVTLGATTGTPATLGNLPTFYLQIESRRLPENVEYFRFNVFFDPPRLMGALQKSVESAKDADGYIIDLRGNPGGIGGLAMGMGGWFVQEDNIKLGTMITRSGTLNFALNPRVRSYAGPLAILIDGLSGSTSEILAGGMKDIGRARIFGQRSAGAALPSVFEKLPNGDRFQYAVANYISAGGQALEGKGVEPDEVVVPDRASLLAGKDPVVEAAVRWFASKKPAPLATGTGAGGTN